MSVLRPHSANLHERVETFSNLLGSCESKTHVNVVSVSSMAVYPSAQAPPRASPKVKEEQSEPFPGSSAGSVQLGPDKTLQTESNDGASLTRKPLDPHDQVEDVTSTDASSSEKEE